MPDRHKSAKPAFGATSAERPLSGPFAACGAWVLGTVHLQRRSLQLILVAAGVYGLSMLAQWNAVALGMADGEHAAWLAASIGAGICASFVAVRSGVTARLADPALPLPQMVFAIFAIALAYAINPHVRALMPMLAGLVIMFAAFTLEPRRCLQLGLFGVLAFAVTIGLCAWRQLALFPPQIEVHHFVFVVITLPTMAYLAGRMSQLRLHWRQQRRELREALDYLAAGQEALVLAKADAEAASQAKSRFLANMSHELRSPLNAVIGAAQLLRAERDDAEQQAQLIAGIQRSGANLLGLIENILDLSRIEAGAVGLRPVDFHLVECIDSALASAELAAQAKGLRLACVVSTELSAWRHGDADRLRQVVMNLLGNAVKFTDHGEVTVRVEPGALPQSVRISVTDTGVGIEAAGLAHIFEPFRQADEGADRRYGGSGLGLAIVRQLVVAMGGHISVASRVGEGSRFETDLPLPLAAAVGAEPEALRRNVLFVEPHEASAQALQAHLLRLGCKVQRCHSAAQARDALACMSGAAQPWLLLSAEAPEQEAVLDAVVDLIEPEHVIVMADRTAYDAERVREAMHLPRQLSRPVTRAALVSRMTAERVTEPGSLQLPHSVLAKRKLEAMTHGWWWRTTNSTASSSAACCSTAAFASAQPAAGNRPCRPCDSQTM